MAIYQYSALNDKGKEVKGILEAESSVSAGATLKRMGFYPVAINETTQQTIEKKGGDLSLSSIFERITSNDISIFTTQFAGLIEAGMPVIDSFDIVIQQTQKKPVKEMLSVIKEEVNKGASLSDSLTLFPKHFSNLYINMVKAGEESGSLDIILKRLSDYLQGQLEMKSRITASIAYPCMMLIICIAVVIFLVAYVVPVVTGIFEEMDRALPLPTVVLLAISNFIKQAWPWMIATVLGLIIVFRWYRSTSRGRKVVDRLKLKLPIFGNHYRKIAMTGMTRTLATLLSNGVSIVKSFDIVKSTIDNVIISRALEKAGEEIEGGKEISKPLAASGIIPPIVVNMIAVGEKSGQLEEMLNRVSKILEAELDSSLKKLISMLEPTMILIMAVIVAFIVISILLPIFEMNQLVH